MCIYIRYSMSIIEKVFHYEENEISVIKCRDDIWFRGKDIAKALGYEKTRNEILKHVDDDDKSILEDFRRGPKFFFSITDKRIHLFNAMYQEQQRNDMT